MPHTLIDLRVWETTKRNLRKQYKEWCSQSGEIVEFAWWFSEVYVNEKDRKCEWEVEDADYDIYKTSCKQSFQLIESTPKDNGMKFCPYCGKEIKE